MEKRNGAKLNYKNSELHFGDHSLKEVIKNHGTPLYLYSKKELEKNYLDFKEAAAALNAPFEVCFALKSNPNPEVIKALAALGAGGDIVSKGELKRAMECGISPSKIVFSGVGKTQDEIDEALRAKIKSFNVESVEELEMINERAKALDTDANVAFRLNPRVKALTHKYISTGFKTHKFGLLEADILKAVQDKKLWERTRLVGLSVHIGSQLTELGATGEAVKALCQCAKKLPAKLDFLDVGGGLGVNYEKSNKAPELVEYMALIKENIDLDYPVEVVFEPGRRIAASAGVFLSKVIRTKKSEDCRFLIIDGGMNDFARPSLYQAYHEIYAGIESQFTFTTDIVGPICETADCFGESRKMPELSPGDFVAIADTGAYGYSMSSNYNMREKPKEVLL